MGGKYTGSHTTVIPAAGIVADIAHKCQHVTKIALGFIKAGLPPAKGRKAVKVTVAVNGSLLLSIRDNVAHQEIRVFTNDTHRAVADISAGIRDEDIVVSVQQGAQ
jgi:hypothetical protein